jgi:hypothetical protein
MVASYIGEGGKGKTQVVRWTEMILKKADGAKMDMEDDLRGCMVLNCLRL